MTLNRFRNWFVFAASSVVLGSSALAAPAIKNVVLVHGAFVDGSGWQPVYDIRTKDGYHVTLVQEPLTSLEEDVGRHPPDPRSTGWSDHPGYHSARRSAAWIVRIPTSTKRSNG
jgi:hypothetical protein